MGKLILVRHGGTATNLIGRMHITNDKESLTDRGRLEMQKTALELSKYKPDFIYSSIEIRAVESTKIINSVLNIPYKKVGNLNERKWGVYEGKSWSEVENILSKMNLNERYNFIPDNGESWKNVETRLISAVKKILDKNKVVVLVTHGGAIRTLMPYLLNKGKEESFKYDFDNASLTIFDFEDNKFKKVKINSTEHLLS